MTITGRVAVAIVAMTSAGSVTLAADESKNFHDDPRHARIIMEDMEHFWSAWDAVRAAEDKQARVRIFETRYFARGSAGLKEFFATRIGSAEKFVQAIDGAPRYYAALRSLAPAANGVHAPVKQAYVRLAELYPQAVFPDVYLLMGRMNAGGTIGESGLLIGFEMHGKVPDAPLDELNDWQRQVLRAPDALPYIIAHELIHFQQVWSDEPSLLEATFLEGSADFVAEMISGGHINAHVHEWALQHEEEVWKKFSGAMHGTDYTGFLYGGSDGEAPDGWPQDVGYFIGYRIAEAYYEQADDKRQALADILGSRNFEALLEKSGYSRRFD